MGLLKSREKTLKTPNHYSEALLGLLELLNHVERRLVRLEEIGEQMPEVLQEFSRNEIQLALSECDSMRSG